MLYSLPLLAASSSIIGGDMNNPGTVAFEEYRQCVFVQADRLASLDEPAETVARAAGTACASERGKMRTENSRGLPVQARKLMADLLDDMERDVRHQAELRVLEVRLKAGG